MLLNLSVILNSCLGGQLASEIQRRCTSFGVGGFEEKEVYVESFCSACFSGSALRC